MYEEKNKPLLSKKEFIGRIFKNLLVAFFFLAISLVIGMIGYHYSNDLPWIDSLLNASMILTGMGPVDPAKTDAAKLFASAYAIFSGVAFLSIFAIILAPVVHRFLHKFHLEDDE